MKKEKNGFMENRCYGCMQLKTQSPICEHCGFVEGSNNLSHQLPVGTILNGQYVIGRVLGQGGFGITYIGWDSVLETTVAIKEYYPNNFVTRDCRSSLSVFCTSENAEDFFYYNRERFVKEAKILAKLRTVPGVVRVQNLFEENNTAYIVMEYIQGVDLKSYMRMQNRHLSAEETFSVIRPVIYSLATIHHAGLIHRDITPDNIMIQNDGTVKLLDFGAAREVVNADVNKNLPQSTEAVLKHGFAPIEQYQRRGNIGPWTDIYALCATIYYCLTGTVPSGAPGRLMGEDNVNWNQIPDLTESQIEVLKKGFDIRPENRIQSAEDLGNGLFEQNRRIVQKESPQKTEVEVAASHEQDARQTEEKKKNIGKITAALLAAVLTAGVFGVQSIRNRNIPDISHDTEAILSESDYSAETIPDAAVQETNTVDLTLTSWENNILTENPQQYFGEIEKADIGSVTFLDTVENCPAGNWDVSEAQDKSVLAWAEKRDGLFDIYIAAEGGINAANACRGLFEDYSQLKTVRFNNCFHTENADDMRNMFRSCRCITFLDLSEFDTSGVANMSAMFADCESLTSVDLAGVDTSHVADMSYMFSFCKSLTSLDLSGIDTSDATNMCGMFSHCEALLALDLSGFDTSHVTDMSSMFSDCYCLESLNMSGVETGCVRDMRYMFYNCQKLASLDLSSFETASVTNMCQMFYNCENITSLDLSNFNFSYVTDMSGMFSYCSQLSFLDLGEIDISRHINSENMYVACNKLPNKYKHYA